MILQQIVTAYFSFWRKCGYTLRQNRVSKGYPFGTRLCLQSVVCYTLCRRCCENEVAPGRARAFEAAGKQGCDCVAWSRKHRVGFISRQGVYESPVPRPTPNLWIHSRKNWNGREAILGLSRLVCLSAKTGGTVNGGAWNAPFTLPLTGPAGFAISHHFNKCVFFSIAAFTIKTVWGLTINIS